MRSVLHRSTLVLTVLAAGAVVVVPALSEAQDRAGASPADEGYAIGFDLGRDTAAQLKSDGVSADRDAIVKGFADALGGRQSAMDADRMESVLTELQRRVGEKAARERYDTDGVFRALADKNKAEGDSFRAAFVKREGARALPSGVVYSVVREGAGDAVGDASAVVANYVAMFPDGTEYRRGRGTEFRISTLLPGAQDFVRKMRVGDRAYVAIPPERAYGLAGKEGEIGPNETIVLDIEIVDAKR